MSRIRLRTPAIRPVIPAPAAAIADDPSGRVEAHFRAVWESAMHDMPFVNPALSVEAVGFQRWEGDWLGVVVTPWFINLFLLPGGGSLWRDLPTGEFGAVALPVGELEFIGDNPGAAAPLEAYQYCPLISPVQHVEHQDAARAIARDALATVLLPPSGAAAEPAVDAVERSGPDATPAGEGHADEPVSLARRGFLRAVGGKHR